MTVRERVAYECDDAALFADDVSAARRFRRLARSVDAGRLLVAIAELKCIGTPLALRLIDDLKEIQE